jgi:hypothetical protein
VRRKLAALVISFLLIADGPARDDRESHFGNRR